MCARPEPDTRSSVRPKSALRTRDALDQLRLDHELIRKLLREYDGVRLVEGCGAERKAEIVDRLCDALSLNALIEEEIFYPAVQAALKDKLLVPEATVEHTSVKELIAQLEDVEPDGEMYDAKVKVLSEYVKHHVKEEQNEMFPKVKSSSLDTVELGERMAARKDDLMALAV